MRAIANAALLAVLCAACGGGSNSSAIPTPGPPPPPLTAPPLQLGQENAEGAAVIGIALMGSALQLTGLAAESIKKVASQSEGQFSEICPFNGTADYDFSDADQDGVPSAGDSIRVTYTDCLISVLGLTGSGTFFVTLNESTEQATSEDKFYSGTMDARPLVEGLTSVFDFQLHFGFLEESHRALGNLTFDINVDGTIFTERLIDLDVFKRTNLETARNQISVSGVVDSEALAGSVEFDSSKTISGFLNTYPEQGRIELQGALGSRVAAVPYNVQRSTLATIEFDESGNGTFVELTDHPFWTTLVPDYTWVYAPINNQGVRPFDQNDFWFVGGSPLRNETISVGSSLRLQFSRVINSATVPATVKILRRFDEPPFVEQIDVNTEVRGAAIVLRPLQQFRHSSRYRYPLENLSVSDLLGNSAFACCEEFLTTDNLHAVARASPVHGITGASISLDGALSVSNNSSITSYSWQQVNGPEVQIANANQASASFVVPATIDPTVLDMQLTVADTNGELEWDVVEVHAFGSTSDVALLYFSGEEGEEVTLGREWLLSSANSNFVIRQSFSNEISIRFDTWVLTFAAPGDVTIEQGVYENAVPFLTIGSDNPELSLFGDGRSCSTSIGRFEVLDVTYDSNGEVVSASIDFEQACGDTGKKLMGFLRIGSETPFTIAP